LNMSRILEYTTALEKAYETRLSRAAHSKEDKRYLQVLSELASFISSVKRFLNKAIVLDSAFKELKVGRVCYKWFYVEDRLHIVLSRLNPHISLFYDGSVLGVAHSKNFYVAISENTIKLRVNSFVDEIPLDSVDEITLKRSLIMKALGEASNALLKYADEFPVCAKRLHRG